MLLVGPWMTRQELRELLVAMNQPEQANYLIPKPGALDDDDIDRLYTDEGVPSE